jgi:hypothetical protein
MSICKASISWLAQSIRTFATNLHHVRFGHTEGSGQRFGWRPDVCRPDNVARRVSSPTEIRVDVGAAPSRSFRGMFRLGSGELGRTRSLHSSYAFVPVRRRVGGCGTAKIPNSSVRTDASHD